MNRKATARWAGSLREGRGVVSGESGAFRHTPYTFKSRFVAADGSDSQTTNPEELIGAAHAACYTMALTHILEENGLSPKSLDVTASVNISKKGPDWSISTVHLMLHADVPGADDGIFRDLAWEAKEKCPVSRLLNASVSIDVFLDSVPLRPSETAAKTTSRAEAT